MSMDDPRRLAAFHEAGHAVVAQYCGRLAKGGLTIEPKRDFLGMTEILDVLPFEPPSALLDWACCGLAGEVAECVLFEQSPPTSRTLVQARLGGVPDVLHVLTRLHTRYADPVGMLRGLYDRTHKLVRELWPKVEAVAELALERGKLSRDEVRGAVGAAGSEAAKTDAVCERRARI